MQRERSTSPVAAIHADAIRVELEHILARDSIVSGVDPFLQGLIARLASPDLSVPVEALAAHPRLVAGGVTPADIVEAVRSSASLRLDETETRVYPELKSKRSTVILREVGDGSLLRNVANLLETAPMITIDQSLLVDQDPGSLALASPQLTAVAVVASNWFLTFVNEEIAQEVAWWLRSQTLEGKPVQVRIKTESALRLSVASEGMGRSAGGGPPGTPAYPVVDSGQGTYQYGPNSGIQHRSDGTQFPPGLAYIHQAQQRAYQARWEYTRGNRGFARFPRQQGRHGTFSQGAIRRRLCRFCQENAEEKLSPGTGSGPENGQNEVALAPKSCETALEAGSGSAETATPSDAGGAPVISERVTSSAPARKGGDGPRRCTCHQYQARAYPSQTGINNGGEQPEKQRGAYSRRGRTNRRHEQDQQRQWRGNRRTRENAASGDGKKHQDKVVTVAQSEFPPLVEAVNMRTCGYAGQGFLQRPMRQIREICESMVEFGDKPEGVDSAQLIFEENPRDHQWRYEQLQRSAQKHFAANAAQSVPGDSSTGVQATTESMRFWVAKAGQARRQAQTPSIGVDPAVKEEATPLVDLPVESRSEDDAAKVETKVNDSPCPVVSSAESTAGPTAGLANGPVAGPTNVSTNLPAGSPADLPTGPSKVTLPAAGDESSSPAHAAAEQASTSPPVEVSSPAIKRPVAWGPGSRSGAAIAAAAAGKTP